MSRDILKAKLRTQGVTLSDDNCLYRGETLIARDVDMVEDYDCIVFEFDLVDDGADIGMKMTPVPVTTH